MGYLEQMSDAKIESAPSSDNGMLDTIKSNIAFDDQVTSIFSFVKIRIDIFSQKLTGLLWKKTQSPATAVLIVSLVNVILILFDMQMLMETYALLTCLTFVLRIAAFLKLRNAEPYGG